jgi:gas vesicle protein
MERDNSNAVIWFIGGAALGVAVALLTASAAGENTRRELGEQVERGRKTILESGRELYEQGRAMYEHGREIAEEAAAMFEHARSIAEKKIDERI